MAVRRSANILNQQRLDVPHLRSIESAVRNDFDELLRSFVLGEDTALVLRNFDISLAGAIGASANGLQMVVAEGSIFHGTSNESGTFFVVPSGTPNETLNSTTNTKVQGSFTPSALNYIGLEFDRSPDNSTTDTVYFWNPSSAIEFTKTVPLAETFNYRIIISSSIFAANVLPIAIVETDAANNVLRVEDRRPMLFRLGTAGSATPDPFYEYPWTNDAEGRVENHYSSASSAVSPFKGGDKQLKTMKEWMDAVMSNIKEIKGTTYWYSENSGGSLLKARLDIANTIFTGRGNISHSSTTAGRINWSQDIYLTIVGSALKYRIAANPASSFISLANGEVAYLNLVRDQDVVPLLIFTNGSAVVTSVGAAAWTASLQAGDFVRIASGDVTDYYEILTVDSASQVTLTQVYAGASTGISGAPAKYAWGNYEAVAVPTTDRHIQIDSRENVPFNEDTFWLMIREDNALSTAQEVTEITTVADVANSLSGTYFLLNSADDLRKYYVWYDTGASADPAPTGRTGIRVSITTGDSANNVAQKTRNALEIQPDFSATVLANLVTVTNALDGDASNAEDVDTGFSISITTEGAKARVYARFVGSEIEQGESKSINDDTSDEVLAYTGMRDESDSAPAYSTAFEDLNTEVTTITFPPAASITTGQYFLINSANDNTQYYAWFNKDAGGGNPAVAGKTPIEIAISTGDTNLVVAAAAHAAINPLTDFSSVNNLDGTITVTNAVAGGTADASNVNVGGVFSITVDDQGSGEQNYNLVDGENLTKAIKRLDTALQDAIGNFQTSAYDEQLTVVAGAPADDNEITGPVVATTIVSIPFDSRNGEAVRTYTVGEGQLEVYLNGQYLVLGDDWDEVGVAGDESVDIEILQDLVVGDVVTFRIDNGTIGASGGSGVGEANTASNLGGGASVFSSKVGVDLRFRSIVAGANVSVTQSGTEITIASSAGTALADVDTIVGVNYGILTSDDVLLVDNNGSDVTLTLPDASTAEGKIYYIKKTDSGNSLYIKSVFSQTLDGVNIDATPYQITVQFETATIVSDGANWWIL